MTPFVSAYFFYILAALLAPAVLLGLLGRQQKYYGLFVTLAFLPVIYNTPKSLLFLGIFYVYSLLTAFVYSKLKTKNSIVFWVFLLLMLAPLGIAKFAAGLEWFHITGISYITFRTVQLITGLKEGKIEKLRLFEFTYFVLFFPALSSGPIDRYQRFTQDCQAKRSRAEYFELLREGIWKLFHGLLYSFVLAPAIQIYLLSYFDQAEGVPAIVGYAYAYTLYLFFNFAGYSRLAMGTSYLLGIKTPENFNYPFAARDLKDFWARWHMSLSTFFRDYIYNKFVMLTLKKKWFRNKHIGSYIGYILTMGVMGVWHGLRPHYLVYGLYHGVLMCLNDMLDNRVKGFKKFKNSRFGSVLCAFVTFQVIVFGLLIFSGKLF